MGEIKFSFGRPVPPDQFYNRDQELNQILSRLLTIKNGVKNDITIVGPRRIGKSSIIFFLEHKLAQKGIFTINFDCEGLDLTSFLKTYGNAIIESELRGMGLMQRFGERIKRGFTESISTMAEALGKIRAVELGTSTEDFVKFRIEFDKSTSNRSITDSELEELFESTISLPNNLNKKYVVMFDEFQETVNFNLPRGGFHANFRKSIRDQSNVAYVYTGSAIGMMDTIFSDPNNPLAGSAEIVQVRPFDRKTSCSFLENRFNKADRIISKEVEEYIFNKVGGFPAYLNWVGLRICDLVPENKKISKNIAEKVCEEIHTSISPIYQMIEKQLVKLGLKTKRVLYFMSLGYKTPTEIGKEVNVKNIYVYLNRLQSYGLIFKNNDNNYELIDPIIIEHLKRT
jgi:AAA+ ATPase superfamily predicted ATPase